MVNGFDPQRAAQFELQGFTRHSDHLSKLSHTHRLQLTAAGIVKEFPGQQVMLAEGSEIEDLYLIQHGVVSVGLYQEVSPALWLYLAGPGTMVDMCALLDPPVAPASVYAVSDVTALAIPREVVLKVLAQAPAVFSDILRALASQLSLITQLTVKEFCQKPPQPSLN